MSNILLQVITYVQAGSWTMEGRLARRTGGYESQVSDRVVSGIRSYFNTEAGSFNYFALGGVFLGLLYSQRLIDRRGNENSNVSNGGCGGAVQGLSDSQKWPSFDLLGWGVFKQEQEIITQYRLGRFFLSYRHLGEYSEGLVLKNNLGGCGGVCRGRAGKCTDVSEFLCFRGLIQTRA